MSKEVLIHNEEDLRSKIYTIRGVQVMLDFDLAEIYGYDTKRFNEQVKNNKERFDEDFRFQLTKEEFDNLRSKNSTAKTNGIYHDRYIFIDFGSTDEKIYHCGGSSKDGGIRTTAISQVEDTSIYKIIAKDLQKNPILIL